MNYDEVINDIYRTYVSASKNIKDLLDKDARDISIILDVAKDLNVIPPKDKVVKITGSKGKGTTTRLIARLLQKNSTNAKVAMLISPESVDHNDRIRIGFEPITKERFCEIYTYLKPHLEKRLSECSKPNAYLSPSGIFMLIGLVHFKENSADLFVLETGRGSKFDEVGNLESKVSVVTSIFNEHLDKLGPTINDIAINKLSISEKSELTIIHKNCEKYLGDFSPTRFKVIRESASVLGDNRWLSENYSIARIAVKEMLGLNEIEDIKDISSPSFFSANILGHRCLFDGAIAPESLNLKILESLSPVSVICSFPDDKNPSAMVRELSKASRNIHHVIIKGDKTSLRYDKTRSKFLDQIIKEISSEDELPIDKIINELSRDKRQTFYFVGTQSYLRTIKRWLIRNGLIPNESL